MWDSGSIEPVPYTSTSDTEQEMLLESPLNAVFTDHVWKSVYHTATYWAIESWTLVKAFMSEHIVC